MRRRSRTDLKIRFRGHAFLRSVNDDSSAARATVRSRRTFVQCIDLESAYCSSVLMAIEMCRGRGERSLTPRAALMSRA
jgi:hypothetical protein